MDLSDKQLNTLRHMLGINDPFMKVPKSYRNYAAVNPGDKDFLELEKLGVIRKYCCAGSDTQYDYYTCTDVGKLAAINSHKNIRKRKPQRMYAQFLNIKDYCPSITFKDFLIRADYKSIREDV